MHYGGVEDRGFADCPSVSPPCNLSHKGSCGAFSPLPTPQSPLLSLKPLVTFQLQTHYTHENLSCEGQFTTFNNFGLFFLPL